MTFIQEMELSSKFSSCPKEKWRFSIVTLQLNSIRKKFCSFLQSFADVKTTFGIYKPSKIRIIHIGGYTCISDRFKMIFQRKTDNVRFFFKNFHSFYQRLSRIFESWISEIKKNFAFFFFLNQKRFYSWKKFISFLGKNKMVRWNSVFLSRFFNLNSAFKMILKPFNVIKMSRNNGKGVLKKWRGFNFSNIETPIPVNVTCCVS